MTARVAFERFDFSKVTQLWMLGTEEMADLGRTIAWLGKAIPAHAASRPAMPTGE